MCTNSVLVNPRTHIGELTLKVFYHLQCNHTKENGLFENMCFNHSFDNYVLSLWTGKHYETDAERNYYIRIRNRH